MDHILLDDSDDEFENKEWEQKYSGRSGFVFILDARKPMFIGGKESYFKKSFQCCLNAMLQIAREQRYDLFSIILFGTKKSEGKFAPQGTVVFQPLYTPSIPLLKNNMSLIEDQFESIIQNYGHGEVVLIDQVLDYCKKLLHYCKTKLYTKSIVLFTCDDNPHLNDIQSDHRARKRAGELKDHNIEFDVVGLGSFDSSKFYKELVLTSRGELLKDWANKDPVKNIDDVEAEIASLTKKITRHYGMFYLGKNVQMKLIFYKLYHEPQKLIWASKDHDDLVSGEGKQLNEFEKQENEVMNQENEALDINATHIYEAETQDMGLAKILEEPKKKAPEKYPLIGGEYIPMSKKELQWYEAKVPRGLSLIGFKPLSSIPIQSVCGEPYFLLPDSSEKNSEKMFTHLLHSCLRKGVVPVCWYSFTRAGNPALVVLLPTEPAKYGKGMIHSHGFHLIKLPFSDMITDYSDDLPKAESSESQIEAANKIVKKTTINWTPDTFSDHEYKSRIAMIEAIAMEYEDVAEVVDQTDIDLEAIDERLGNLSAEFIDCSHLPSEALGKRPGTESNFTKAKEPKLQDTGYLISMVKAGEANKLTVAQLKELLRGEGIKSLSALPKPRLIAIANERFRL